MGDRAIVVGAGIAGLTAAYRLSEAGYQVIVLEAADRVGGRMATIQRDGYTLDTGATMLSSRYTVMTRLAEDIGIGPELRTTDAIAGTLRDGVVHRMRSHTYRDALTTGLLSPRAKLATGKMLIDMLRLGGRLDPRDVSRAADFDTESVRAYAERRLGREVLDFLVDPITRAVNQGTVDELSCVDFLFSLRNFLGGRLMNFDSGIARLPLAIADKLDVRLGARVTGVTDGPGEVTVSYSPGEGPEETLAADRCVIALSAHDMAAVFPGLGAERAAIVGALRYSTLWTILLATRTRGAEPCVFVQVPTLVHPHLTAVMFEHNKHPGRVPDGMGLISTYWLTEWYESMADEDDAAVTEAAVRAVAQVLPGTPLDLAFSHVTRWRPAVLLAGPGAWREVRRFHALTPPTARVQFAGDYIGGSTTNSALSSGERAAGIIIANPV